MKKFVIAVAAAFALLAGAGTASAGHYGHNVTVIRQFAVTGGAYGCGGDAVNVVKVVKADTCGHDAVAVAAEDYVAPVRVIRQVQVNANYGYGHNTQVVEVVNNRFRGVRGGVRATGGNSGVVGAAKVVVNTAKNLIGDIIGN